MPPGQGARVTRVATEHGASTVLELAGDSEDVAVDLRILQASNRSLERLIDALGEIQDLHLSFFPQGVLTLDPPADQPPERVRDVTLRSPIEIFLSGLQSVGSWPGFVSYAAVGAVIAWTGLLTNTAYLLVGAMLIAPFAEPAMTAAMATARGDSRLLLRSLGRYGAALAVSVAVTAVCTLLYRLEAPTALMSDVATVAVTAVLLPLAAGAAGAVNLAQSERSSLVSGAATGMLVAAALAPPAAVVGMALAIGEWGMAGRTAFLLVLQLVGINAAGAAVFRLVGLGPRGARYPHGRPTVQRMATAATVVALAVLVTAQLATTSVLERSTLAQRAEELIAHEVERRDGLLLDAAARFPATGGLPDDTMLVVAYIQSDDDDSSAWGRDLEEVVETMLDARAVVSVTVVPPR